MSELLSGNRTGKNTGKNCESCATYPLQTPESYCKAATYKHDPEFA